MKKTLKALKIFGIVLATLVVIHIGLAVGGRFFIRSFFSDVEICQAEMKKIMGISMFESLYYDNDGWVEKATYSHCKHLEAVTEPRSNQ